MYENVELCFACRHFVGRKEYTNVLLGDVRGLCHARPPIPCENGAFAVFPYVRANYWCGLWEPRRSPVDEALEELYEFDRPKSEPTPHPVQEDPIDPESWWAAYECRGCRAAREPFPSTCFDVRFDGIEPLERVTCPVCGAFCKLSDRWNATKNGFGSRSEKDARCNR